jgi:acylglycerol lipase
MQPAAGTVRTRTWPATATPWATLLLVHGLGEHAGRYDHVARRMAAAGIAVRGYDHPGFGGSGGRRGHVERWTDLHRVLADELATAQAAAAKLPLVLYGHSLGGLIALGYVMSVDPDPLPDRLVLTSPALDSSIAGWKKAIAPVLGRVAPRLRIPNGLTPGILSRDPAVDERNRSDPLMVTSSTARFGAEAFAEQRRLRHLLAAGIGPSMPTYAIHGADDRLVPAGASKLLEGLPGVTRRVYPGLRHETHNEPEGLDVVDDTIAWLRSSLSA